MKDSIVPKSIMPNMTNIRFGWHGGRRSIIRSHVFQLDLAILQPLVQSDIKACLRFICRFLRYYGIKRKVVPLIEVERGGLDDAVGKRSERRSCGSRDVVGSGEEIDNGMSSSIGGEQHLSE